MKISRLWLSSLLLLTACNTDPPMATPDAGIVGDAGPTGDAGPNDAATSPNTVSGVATYEDLVPAASGLPHTGPSSPIRRARVRVLDASGAMLGEGVTDEAGAFAIDLGAPPPSGAQVEVAAALHDDVSEAYVTTIAETLHVLRVPVTGASTTVHASAQMADGRIAGPFNVLDRLVRMGDFLRTAAPAGTVMPRIVVHWEIGSTDGTNAHPGETSAFGDACIVRLLGQADVDDDAFDDTVISHEIGHCVAFEFSSYASGRWHTHSSDLELEAGLAMNEGIATYLGQRMSGTSQYVDTHGDADGFGHDLEDPGATGQALSLYGEGAVAGALWDLTDSGAGDDDPFAISNEDFWAIFHEDVRDGVFKSIETYLDAVVARGLATDAELDAAFGEQLGLHRPMSPTFPMAMLVPDAPITGDVDATMGGNVDEHPLVVALDTYGFELDAETTIRIDLTNTNHVSDLDLFLEDTERNEINTSNSTGTMDEWVVSTLPAGRYVVVVRAWDGPETAAPYSLVLTMP